MGIGPVLARVEHQVLIILVDPLILVLQVLQIRLILGRGGQGSNILPYFLKLIINGSNIELHIPRLTLIKTNAQLIRQCGTARPRSRDKLDGPIIEARHKNILSYGGVGGSHLHTHN